MKLNKFAGLAGVIIILLGTASFAIAGGRTIKANLLWLEAEDTIRRAVNNQTLLACGVFGVLLLMRRNRHESRAKQ